MQDNMYDAVVTLALSALKATQGMSDPSKVTGDQVRAAMHQINDASGTKVGAGAAEFARVPALLQAKTAINYEGASGPVDFDDSGNIIMRLSLYHGENGAFVDHAIYNCIADLATCPKE
jgi:hypothetical protein